MVPTKDETVDGLKSIIGKLESRVSQLEDRLVHGDKPKTVTEHMRMVLMGPPGAGALQSAVLASSFFAMSVANTQLYYRQGNSGSKDQGEILRLSSRTHHTLSATNRGTRDYKNA